MSNTDDLIKKYAKEIERIISQNTAGDYTWNGLLFSFLREVDESRTLKYEVGSVDDFGAVDEENRYYDIQTYDEKLGWTRYSVYLNHDIAQKILKTLGDDVVWRLVDHGASTEEDEPEKEPELLYDVVVTKMGQAELYASKVSFEEAQGYLKEAPFWQAPRIVVNEESLNDTSYYDDKKFDPEEKTYDVHVHDGWWRLLESNVSKAHADELVKGLTDRYIIEEHDNGGPIYSDDDYMDGCDKY